MGSVDSPINANPPVPEDRSVAREFASSRNAPIAAIRNAPHANRPMVARLRFRRRAPLRNPRPPNVSRARGAPRPNARNQADDPPNPAMSNNAPALKNVSAEEVSWLQTAAPTKASAEIPANAATHAPRFQPS